MVLLQVRLDVQFTSTAGEVEGEYSHSVAAVWLESQTKIKGPTYFFTFPTVKSKPYLWEAGTYRFTFVVVSCLNTSRSALGVLRFLVSVALCPVCVLSIWCFSAPVDIFWLTFNPHVKCSGSHTIDRTSLCRSFLAILAVVDHSSPFVLVSNLICGRSRSFRFSDSIPSDFSLSGLCSFDSFWVCVHKVCWCHLGQSSCPPCFRVWSKLRVLVGSSLQNGQHDPPVKPLVRTITVRPCDTIGKWLLPGSEDGLPVRLGVPFNLRVRQEDILG